MSQEDEVASWLLVSLEAQVPFNQNYFYDFIINFMFKFLLNN